MAIRVAFVGDGMNDAHLDLMIRHARERPPRVSRKVAGRNAGEHQYQQSDISDVHSLKHEQQRYQKFAKQKSRWS